MAPGYAAPTLAAWVTPSPRRMHAAWCDGSPATASDSGLAAAQASIAAGHRVRKPHPLGGLAGLGRSPDEHEPLPTGAGDGGEQGLGVGMGRAPPQVGGGGLLDDPSQVHDHHPVG